MVRRLFRANETFRGRIRAELIRTSIKAVPPAPPSDVSAACIEAAHQCICSACQRKLFAIPTGILVLDRA